MALRAAVETREVVEDERAVVDLDIVRRRSGAAPVGQVPGRDVKFGLAYDRDIVEERRRQVDPALIGEQTARNIVVAELPEPVGPPIDEPGTSFRCLHR